MQDDAPGTVIDGKYELVEVAGAGGMATVWRATARGAAGFQRPVAVKRILPGHASDPDFVQMFVEEARVVSALQHPNIVQIHDFGLDATKRYYFVMEWVEGMDLADWWRSFAVASLPTPWPMVAAIGIEVLKALRAAHDRTDAQGSAAPVYHRDVSPGNVLIGRNGIVKLSDFGLARAMDRTRMTRPDVVKGKLAYLAPEITFGQPVSVQSDLFGVGCVLWESLAARRLFEAEDNLELVRKVREGDVSHLSTLRPDVPSSLIAIVYRALAKDPSHRPGSAKEMQRSLSQLLRGTDQPSDAEELAQTVDEGRRRLVEGGHPAPSSAQYLDSDAVVPLDQPSGNIELPLTRVKPTK